MDLRVENPKTTQAFVAALEQVGVRLPVDLSRDEGGSVVDADGKEVFVVDANRERDDTEVELIARWIVLAINTCGGFKAEIAANG